MRSTHPYPRFQRLRDEMDIRPLRYKCQSARNAFRVEDWRERGYDQKHLPVSSLPTEARAAVFGRGSVLHFSRRNLTPAKSLFDCISHLMCKSETEASQGGQR